MKKRRRMTGRIVVREIEKEDKIWRGKKKNNGRDERWEGKKKHHMLETETERGGSDMKGREDLYDRTHYYVHYNGDGGRVREQKDSELRGPSSKNSCMKESRSRQTHAGFHFNT